MADIHFIDDDEAIAAGSADEAVVAAVRSNMSDEEIEALQDELVQEEAAADPNDHNANLAEELDEKDLDRIAADLIERIEQDKESRREWRERFAEGLKKLGIVEIEEPKTLFEGAATVVHPMLAEAAVQFQARAMAELFPPAGPIKTKIVGDASEEVMEQAQRVEDYMNFHVTEVQEGYADELDDMLFYLPFSGSAFKKCYVEGGKVISKYLEAESVIVPYHTSSLEDAPRITHVNPISQNDMKKAQLSGFYRDVKLVQPAEEHSNDRLEENKDRIEGAQAGLRSDEDDHTVYECHCEYDLPDELADEHGIAWPYIISVDKDSSKVLAIRRNWRPEDKEQRKKRIWFTHYKLMPGFGFYGFGFIHLIGGLSEAATGSLRALLDSAAFANLQGGFKIRGARLPGGEIRHAPGDWNDIDYDGDDISKAVLPLPYKEPSQALFNLLGFLVDAGQRFANTTEAMVGDANNTGPVGTTLALIEQGSKVYSGIHARLHRAQKREFRLLAELIGGSMEQGRTIEVQGIQVSAEDFDERVDVIPVSDPKIFSQTQRIAQAQTTMEIAEKFPTLHDQHAALERFYDAIGVPEHEQILLDPDLIEPMDPLSENMSIMVGKPVRAFEWEDHQSHMAVHMAFMQDPMAGGHPQAQKMIGPPMMAHMAEHMAHAYRQRIMQAMGQAGQYLPQPDLHKKQGKPSETPGLPPQALNMIAQATAQAVQRMKPQQQKTPEQQQAEDEARKTEAEIAMKGQQAKADMARKDRESQAKVTRETAITAADIQRKDRESTAKIARESGQAAAEIALDDQESAAEISRETAETVAEIALKDQESEAKIEDMKARQKADEERSKGQ